MNASIQKITLTATLQTGHASDVKKIDMSTLYGQCKECGYSLTPIWFVDEEVKVENGRMWYTGGTRTACDYLICENCGSKYCVDDSFDGPWRYPWERRK